MDKVLSWIPQDTLYAVHTVYNVSEKVTVKNSEEGKTHPYVLEKKWLYRGLY